MSAGVAQHPVPSRGQVLLDLASEGRGQRGEDDVAFQSGLARLHDEIASRLWQIGGKTPAARLMIGLAHGSLRRGDDRDLEPGIATEQLHESLSHSAGRAKNARTYGFHRSLPIPLLCQMASTCPGRWVRASPQAEQAANPGSGSRPDQTVGEWPALPRPRHRAPRPARGCTRTTPAQWR